MTLLNQPGYASRIAGNVPAGRNAPHQHIVAQRLCRHGASAAKVVEVEAVGSLVRFERDMRVHIDEAWRQGPAASIDHGSVRSGYILADLDDVIAFDQHIGIHREFVGKAVEYVDVGEQYLLRRIILGERDRRPTQHQNRNDRQYGLHNCCHYFLLLAVCTMARR